MLQRLAVFSLLAVFMFCAVPCWPQLRPPPGETAPRTFYIRGSLRSGDDGRAMEMIRVELKRVTGETVGISFSRSNGEFEFSQLPSGLFVIVVEERGYETIRENIEIFNMSRPGVLLFLTQPILQTGAQKPLGMVSARELVIPRKAHGAMQKGINHLYEKKDSKGSLAHFQRAVVEFPSYYEAYHQMGVAYLRLGQMVEAEQALRKSIELSQSRYAEAHFALASLLSDRNEFSEAELLARRALDRDGSAWRGHFELARALAGMDRTEAAEKSALQARARKPDFAAVHLLLANIHIRKKDHPALLEDLDAYLALEPNGPMSDQARQTRENVQRGLANAQNPPSTPRPEP